MMAGCTASAGGLVGSASAKGHARGSAAPASASAYSGLSHLAPGSAKSLGSAASIAARGAATVPLRRGSAAVHRTRSALAAVSVRASAADKPSVAVLGIGLLGAKIAVRLHQQGHHVTVWNRTASKAEALRPAGVDVAASVVRAPWIKH